MRRAVAMILAGLLPAAAHAVTIETFSLPNGQDTCGIAIASDGTVLGTDPAISGTPVYFLYKAGQFTSLKQPLPGGLSSLSGLNSHLVIAGANTVVNGSVASTTAFAVKHGKVTPFTLSGAVNIAATGINNAGTLIGWYQTTPTGPTLGFTGSAGGVSTLDNGSGSTLPTAINATGNELVGVSLASGAITGWLYSNNAFTSLAAPNASGTFAYGVYGAGHVTGTYTTGAPPNVVPHGFLYHAGKFTDFTVPGASQTEVFGANQRGQFTGCETDSAGLHGFIATP